MLKENGITEEMQRLGNPDLKLALWQYWWQRRHVHT
jgi:hypothetical protein